MFLSLKFHSITETKKHDNELIILLNLAYCRKNCSAAKDPWQFQFAGHKVAICTGKSLSEALLFAENMLCTEIVLNVKNNFCTQHVPPMF